MNQKTNSNYCFTAYHCSIFLKLQSTTNKLRNHKSNTASGDLDRTVLPIKEPSYPEDTTLDARDAKAPARFEIKARLKHRMLLLCLLMTRASVYQVHLVAR
jgi:hypothetical protein